MSDTQWPRYQVFLQEKENSPHQDVGSVHAPDAEMALLNARDVFVRRPECVSLWIAPAEAIYSKTAEELRSQRAGEPGGGGAGVEGSKGEGEREAYYVFCKAKANGTQTYVETLEATGAEQALQQAIERYQGKRPPFAWWAVPARRVVKSDPGDIESMFAPAFDKPFRLSTDFHTVTAMRQLRTGSESKNEAGHEK